jgi:subtilisin-like proprotein convertase family protein
MTPRSPRSVPLVFTTPLALLGLGLLAADRPESAPPSAVNESAELGDFKGGRGYYNGADAYPVELERSFASVQFEGALDGPTIRALLASEPLVDRAALSAQPISELNWTRAPLLAGASEAQVLEAVRRLDQLPGVVYAQPYVRRTGELLGLTDQLLVSFEKEITAADAAAEFARRGLTVVERLDYVEHGYLLSFDTSGPLTALELSSALYESGLAEWALPDFVVERVSRATPNDPNYNLQWHLATNATTASYGIAASAHVNAEAAWNVTTGSTSVIIAIIDDGVETAHQDLSANMVAGYDYLGNDSNPNPGSSDHHGTAVAGVAGARGNNGIGVSGIAWNCKLMPIRLVGVGQTTAKEAQAISFAKNNGAAVMNNSWGPPDGTGQNFPLPANVKAAIDDAVANGRGGKGCVIFWAAGNGNESADLDGYAAYANVISVAASNSVDQKASYSDFGNSVDVCAPSSGGPGYAIVTTDRTGSAGYASGNYTSTFGGTSSASPLAAGVGALVISANPNLTFAQVRGVLTSTATKIGSGYNAQGFSVNYGYGKVNAGAAVAAAQGGGGGGGGGATNFSSTDVPKAIPDNNTAGVSSVLNVAGLSGTVTDLDVTVNITHTYKGDLDVYLQRPDGTSVLLHNNTGGSADNIVTTYDTLTTPAQPLSNLFGGAANGTWRLWAYDSAAQDVGTIQAWSLAVTAGGSGGGGGGSLTVNSSGTPLAIPDNNSTGITNNLGVSGLGGSLSSVDVAVNITHTYKGDLRVTLVHPDGTQVILHNQTGGSTDNVQTTYDTLTVPAQSLATLNGKGATGTWQLRVQDLAAQDLGTLQSWSLMLVTN